MEIFGNMESGTLTANPLCGEASWFGMATGSSVGSIQLVLQGKGGNLLLDYDNCGHTGIVMVYLDDILISSAPGGTNKIASVPYTHGQILRIQDENGDAIIQVNKLYILFRRIEECCRSTAKDIVPTRKIRFPYLI